MKESQIGHQGQGPSQRIGSRTTQKSPLPHRSERGDSQTTPEPVDRVGRYYMRLLLAERCLQWHNAFMSVQITIRGVPQEVRDELAARAALQRQSMQEFLRCELERIASRPSLGAWLQGVRDRKEAADTQVPPSSILSARDADRT